MGSPPPYLPLVYRTLAAPRLAPPVGWSAHGGLKQQADRFKSKSARSPHLRDPFVRCCPALFGCVSVMRQQPVVLRLDIIADPHSCPTSLRREPEPKARPATCENKRPIRQLEQLQPHRTRRRLEPLSHQWASRRACP
jgi:hypothetical protein